jgi:hypothetical protein
LDFDTSQNFSSRQATAALLFCRFDLLPQTTCGGFAPEAQATFWPPSPPAEEATASQYQARQSGTDGRDESCRK